MSDRIKTLKMENFSIAELEEIVVEATEILDAKRGEKATEIANQMQELARKEGLPFVSVLLAAGARPPPRRSGNGTVKYRHPELSKLTWSGIGRKPNWVKKWEEEGRSIEECLVAA